MGDVLKFDELREVILTILPNAQFDEDQYGQLIIYTDKALDYASTEEETMDEEILVDLDVILPYLGS